MLNIPDYSRSFAMLPGTIKKLFGINVSGEKILPKDVVDTSRKHKKVVLFLLDAFGWKLLQKFKDEIPELTNLVRNSQQGKIYSQFPSTTAAHITTLQTGLPVSQHGIFEWRIYDPNLNDIILPLKFSRCRRNEAESLVEELEDIALDRVFPDNQKHGFLNDLTANGIENYTFNIKELKDTTYTNYFFENGEFESFKDVAEGLYNLAQSISSVESRSFFYFYYGAIDSVSHDYGPESPQVEMVARAFFWMFENIFLKQLQKIDEEVLILITADHGQIQVDPEEGIYLNEIAPEIKSMMKRNDKGELLTPAGSPRDYFLYIEEQELEDAMGILKGQLRDKAQVFLTSKVIEQGLFGDPKKISKRLKERLGNILILPTGNNQVWWYEEDLFDLHKKGMHGGLTKDELEIPLISIQL
jgi:predicted AlkP superfamily pyrophosphatase or phosphodiesterase